MPKVGKKKFPYTPEGMMAAHEAEMDSKKKKKNKKKKKKAKK